MTKSEQPIIKGHWIRGIPNPRALGFKAGWWKQLQKHVDEMVRLQDRMAEQQQRRRELEAELEYQASQLERQRVEAARADKDAPDDTYLEGTQKALKGVHSRISALQQALGEVESECAAFLQEGPPPNLAPEARARGLKHEAAYRELVQQAEAERDALGFEIALFQWLRGKDERGNDIRQTFSLAPKADSAGTPWHLQPRDWWAEDEEAPVISSANAASFIE
jgi:hypothetical protein